MTREELIEIAGMLKALKIQSGEYGIGNNVLDYCIARLIGAAEVAGGDK